MTRNYGHDRSGKGSKHKQRYKGRMNKGSGGHELDEQERRAQQRVLRERRNAAMAYDDYDDEDEF